jgi:hypothetical protein
MHVHPVLPWNLKLQQPQLPRSEPDGQPTESSQLAKRNPCLDSNFTVYPNWPADRVVRSSQALIQVRDPSF